VKIQIKNYIFDASARTITFSDYDAIDIDSVLYIIHVTDNRAIYNPMNKNLKGSVFGNVLTLNYNTTTMSDDDELQIYYDKIPDPATEETLQSIAGLDYDTETTDITDINNIITTYKKNGVTIRTETTSINGEIINVIKT